ncbi:hypothetical protein A3Q56_07693 [Intoshia linei]|uniref:Uncharacterized protein n=1 Tax=Intoshia linei TaxID=1819745 RepID=A0A177AT97_9BILA|nr:hypothetical protein A3Q56_07693 [Intoshia linei]
MLSNIKNIYEFENHKLIRVVIYLYIICNSNLNDILLILTAPITWEPVDVTPIKDASGNLILPAKAIASLTTNKVGLKGPLATPIGKGHKSLNLLLRNNGEM